MLLYNYMQYESKHGRRSHVKNFSTYYYSTYAPFNTFSIYIIVFLFPLFINLESVTLKVEECGVIRNGFELPFLQKKSFWR